jgi:hypothetical protein
MLGMLCQSGSNFSRDGLMKGLKTVSYTQPYAAPTTGVSRSVSSIVESDAAAWYAR